MRKHIASFGAGTNSTAMLIEITNRGLPLDAIVFADTGGERPHTYAFIETFRSWLTRRGMPDITVIRNDRSPYPSLEQECLARHTLPAIAFGFKSCSDKWKIRPFKRWLKSQNWPETTAYIGFDADEAHRAARGDAAQDPYLKRYPLIDWDMGREECEATIRRSGLPLPAKSACFFCPNSTKKEISSLPPELRRRAIALENNAEGLTTVKGLGRRWRWAEYLASVPGEYHDNLSESPCGCYDGQSP